MHNDHLGTYNCDSRPYLDSAHLLIYVHNNDNSRGQRADSRLTENAAMKKNEKRQLLLLLLLQLLLMCTGMLCLFFHATLL